VGYLKGILFEFEANFESQNPHIHLPSYNHVDEDLYFPICVHNNSVSYDAQVGEKWILFYSAWIECDLI
jgi:hypothetical protein